MKCQTFLLRLLCIVVLLVSLPLTAFAAVDEMPEIVQDVQAETSESPLLESDEQEAAADQLPPEPGPVTEVVEYEQNDPLNVSSFDYWEDDLESEYEEPSPLSYTETTLSDINYTLNSIFFCIVICMACAFVYLVVKIVWPLFFTNL